MNRASIAKGTVTFNNTVSTEIVKIELPDRVVPAYSIAVKNPTDQDVTVSLFNFEFFGESETAESAELVQFDVGAEQNGNVIVQGFLIGGEASEIQITNAAGVTSDDKDVSFVIREAA